MKHPLVSVCIGSIRPNSLRAAVNSVVHQSYEAWELLVVGQGDDPTLQAFGDEAQSRDRRIRYVHSGPAGLSLARNIALGHAEGEIIAMTDDDCEARADWLETIVDRFRDDEALMLVGGTVRKPPRPARLFAACPAYEAVEALYVPAPGVRPPPGWDWMGANFAFRRSLYEAVGPFDEHLGAGATFPAAEDTDYKLRVESRGLPMLSTPRSVVVHSNGYRYGLRSLLRSSRNYSAGNGGLAGKLTLQGDPRGELWLTNTRRQCIDRTVRRLKLHRLPNNLMRLRNFEAAYARCLREFEVTGEGVLAPRSAGLPSAPSFTGPTKANRLPG